MKTFIDWLESFDPKPELKKVLDWAKKAETDELGYPNVVNFRNAVKEPEDDCTTGETTQSNQVSDIDRSLVE